jgi:hypothetical protein
MTASKGTQRVRLFNALRDRAKSRQRGISMKVMERTFDFVDTAQLRDALRQLEDSGHIRIDIGGDRPAMLILKERYSDKEKLERPYVLPRSDDPALVAESPPTSQSNFVTTIEQFEIAGGRLFEPLPPVTRLMPTTERTCEPAQPKPKIPARFIRVAIAHKRDPIELILELAGQMLDLTDEKPFSAGDAA